MLETATVTVLNQPMIFPEKSVIYRHVNMRYQTDNLAFRTPGWIEDIEWRWAMQFMQSLSKRQFGLSPPSFPEEDMKRFVKVCVIHLQANPKSPINIGLRKSIFDDVMISLRKHLAETGLILCNSDHGEPSEEQFVLVMKP